MDWLNILFKRDGTLAQAPFWYAVLGVYVAGLASQTLLSGAVASKASTIPFALSQIPLLWAWNAIHTKRLRDAGLAQWPVTVLTILFAIFMMVLIVGMTVFLLLQNGRTGVEGGVAGSTFAFYILIAVGSILFGIIDPSGMTPIVLGLLFVMFGPSLMAIAFTIWVGTRRSLVPQIATSVPQ
ncbi:hypothetical protein GJW-30_1_02912 [Variibacter gotjawalensis]|uniref:Inner membrane protein YhaH n=1 Tax=Variibacter gotjawalensis TaxID=1333996 RepID=A0A0S3PWT2_9BRAD|nr:hypothetical protein [Variibacter gotjawalensis]NIK46201.1 uncharacterized membrane protein YhaH (DUF805 family) [Variibacter gotjawalensis]RZS48118.1 uncharacterized membrane protein YhaH (DUF805 family) [Variibacter gotjawalensis]BAT60375.1 hypothetical protein GJW-30_1_02912 [Variibacter gotjawalensis]